MLAKADAARTRMHVTTASAVADRGRSNEDFVGAGAGVAVVVDGAFLPGAEGVCHHGVAWYAHRLGDHLLVLAGTGAARSLPALLSHAIEQVTDEHRDTCDTTSPVSPWAAVAMVRTRQSMVEYLVLGDATVVLDLADGPPVVATDPREVTISESYVPALDAARDDVERDRVLGRLRARRNAPGGFWVAKDDPRAADEAVTGRLPVGTVHSVVLLSNGASRLVDRFGLTDWPGALAELATTGPEAVIERVRQAERRHAVAQDDASIALCTDLAGG